MNRVTLKALNKLRTQRLCNAFGVNDPIASWPRVDRRGGQPWALVCNAYGVKNQRRLTPKLSCPPQTECGDDKATVQHKSDLSLVNGNLKLAISEMTEDK
jgi:hypothetical protein